MSRLQGSAPVPPAALPEGPRSFTTSFGRTIPFVPGHLELFDATMGLVRDVAEDWEHASINAAGGHDKLDYARVEGALKEQRAGLSVLGYANRLARSYHFLAMLRETELPGHYRRVLDVGCGYAFQPRILRGLGVVEEAVGIDIYDRATGVDEALLAKRHRQAMRLLLLERLRQRARRVPPDRRGEVQTAVADRLRTPIGDYKANTGWLPDEGLYRLRFRTRPHLDRYVNQDIFTFQERFDLVTSFSSLEWFDHRTILPRIASLLDDGGVFYLWVPNWWCAVNTTRLVGHFPYAAQRLTRDDYFRYLDASLPQHARAMKVAYDYFDPAHPTLADYLETGLRCGLVPVRHHANIQPGKATRKRGITPVGYALDAPADIAEVLEDIHRFRPDVRLADLLANSYSILFQKASPGDRLDAAKVATLRAGTERGASPSSPLVRAARRVAETRLLKG